MKTATLALAAGMCGALVAPVLAQSTSSLGLLGRELEADASNRSSLLGTTGFSANVDGYMQFRFNVTSGDNIDPDDDIATGFQTRRTRLGVRGNISDTMTYRIMGDFGRGTGTFTLLDAYVDWDLGDGWTARFGQFKAPVLREENISSSKQLAAERSTANEAFNQDRSQGVAFITEPSENARFSFGITDGAMTANSDYTSGAEADIALTGRFDWTWTGTEWSRFDDFTSFPGATSENMVGMAGAALHWQTGGSTVGTSDDNLILGTVDVQLEGDGWNAFGALNILHFDPDGGDSTLDMGLVLQGGYFFDNNWEGFARADFVIPDGDRTNDDLFTTVTLGVNYYWFQNHNAKFTADLQIFIGEQNDVVSPSTGYGLLPTNEDSQFAIRAQMQVGFGA